jgi:hypothetical protein
MTALVVAGNLQSFLKSPTKPLGLKKIPRNPPAISLNLHQTPPNNNKLIPKNSVKTLKKRAIIDKALNQHYTSDNLVAEMVI